MAKVFAESHYELRPVVKTLLTSPEFYAAEARGNRVKSPIRLLVGACRDLGIQGELNATLAQAIVPYGQELFNPPTVKGWPSGNEWITATTLALRQRLPEVLLDGKPLSGTEPLGRIRGTLIPRDPVEGSKIVRRLLDLDAEKSKITASLGSETRVVVDRIAPAELADRPQELADLLFARYLVVPPRAATRKAITEAITSVPPDERIPLAARLILASPEYQVE